MRLLSPFLSLLLTPLIAVMPLGAELSSGSTAAGQTNNVLKIRLDDDTKATVETNSFATGYAIIVTDSNGLPVPDAAVAIRLPDDGATGSFVNGQHSAVAYTNASGIAKFPQVNWGTVAGSASVRVTAVKGEFHAGALIEQTVTARPQNLPTNTPQPAAFPPPPAINLPSTPAIGLPPMAASVPPKSPPIATPAKAADTSAKKPGVPTSIAAVRSGATPEAVGTGNTQTAANTEPNVSIVNTSGSKGNQGGNTKKWVILAAVLAGAGAGAAFALAGKGGGSVAAAATTTSIGAPTINLGH